MKLRPLVVLAIVALVWLAGCATVSFKRGAGPGAAKADEDACRATTTSPEDYADCLRNHGWMVNTPGVAAEPASAPGPAADGAAPAKGAPADAGVTPPTVVPAAKSAPHAATAPSATETAKPAAPKSGASGAPAAGSETVPATKPTAAAPSAAKPLDPMTKVTVSSWWKMGGTNAQLDAAVKACVDELGPAHQPNVGPTEVTIALRDCLREKKWFAVGGTGGIGAARFTR